MVFNATLNYISVILCRPVLLVVETGVSWKNHRPVASHWQTLSYDVVSSSMKRINRKTVPVLGHKRRQRIKDKLWITMKHSNQQLHFDLLGILNRFYGLSFSYKTIQSPLGLLKGEYPAVFVLTKETKI
jgi:hypothetical protein